MTSDWQGVIYLSPDLTITTSPLLTDASLLTALSNDLISRAQPATLHQVYTKLVDELAASDITPYALAFAGTARHLPTPSGGMIAAARTSWIGYQNADGHWLDCVSDERLEPELAIEAFLDDEGWMLTHVIGHLGLEPLADRIQQVTGGPLAEHPLRPVTYHLGMDVSVNPVAEQILLLPDSALRSEKGVHEHQPLPHPTWPVLMELQLPRGMTQPLQQMDASYGGRVAIHSMVLDADAVSWSPQSPRPPGAARVLVQAICAEQISSAAEPTARPIALLGVTLRGLDARGRLVPRVTQMTMRGYEDHVPPSRWDTVRNLWSTMTRDWSGIHVSLLHQFQDEWAQPVTHLTPAGQAVRCVQSVPLPTQHASPEVIRTRLERLLTGLKREAPQAWKRLPDLFKAGVPATSELLALLPEQARDTELGKRLLTVGVWRLSRVVYRIDETTLDALWNETAPPHELPTSQLRYLPSHVVYLPLPGREDAQGHEVYGAFFTRLDTGTTREALLIGVHTDDGRVMHTRIPIADKVDVRAALEEQAQQHAPDVDVVLSDRWGQDLLLNLLNAALYLCAVNADSHVQPRLAARDKKSGLPVANTTVEVGVRMGAALRAARRSDATEGTSGSGGRGAAMPPHVRRAHFHTYLYGPLDGERERRLKWLPPIPVNLEFGDDLPVTVHPVQA